MSWILKGLSGPSKDKAFPLKAGLTLGRVGADIIVDDVRASSLHARIVQNEEGRLVLQDNNSKNGIRVNEERVDNVVLTPGLVFSIADTSFVVQRLADQPKPKLRKNQHYWHEVLATFIKTQIERLSDKPVPVTPLDPALVLEFVRGAQADSRWVLGYGPRKVGPSSLDLPIWQPDAPPICFEILPSHDGIIFKTNHPKIVLLNEEAVDSRPLRVGDSIRIMDTVIEVDFIE